MLLRRGAALAKFDGWSYKFRRELLLLTPKPTRRFTSDARARSVACFCGLEADSSYIFHIFSVSQAFIESIPEEMAKDKDPVEEIPRKRILEERPASLSEPLPREKLPKDLQKIVDKQDEWWDLVYDGQYGSLGLHAAIRGLRVQNISEAQTRPIPA